MCSAHERLEYLRELACRPYAIVLALLIAACTTAPPPEPLIAQAARAIEGGRADEASELLARIDAQRGDFILTAEHADVVAARMQFALAGVTEAELEFAIECAGRLRRYARRTSRTQAGSILLETGLAELGALRRLGRFDEALSAAKLLAADAQSWAIPRADRAYARWMLSQAQDLPAAAATLRRALRELDGAPEDEEPAPELRGAILLDLAFNETWLGEVGRAEAHLDDLRSLGDATNPAQVLLVEALVAMLRDDRARALGKLDALIDSEYPAEGEASFVAYAARVALWIHTDEQAAREAIHALITHSTADTRILASALARAGEFLIAIGEHVAGALLLDQAWRALPADAPPALRAWMNLAAAGASDAAGRPAVASEQLQRLLDTTEGEYDGDVNTYIASVRQLAAARLAHTAPTAEQRRQAQDWLLARGGEESSRPLALLGSLLHDERWQAASDWCEGATVGDEVWLEPLCLEARSRLAEANGDGEAALRLASEAVVAGERAHQAAPAIRRFTSLLNDAIVTFGRHRRQPDLELLETVQRLRSSLSPVRAETRDIARALDDMALYMIEHREGRAHLIDELEAVARAARTEGAQLPRTFEYRVAAWADEMWRAYRDDANRREVIARLEPLLELLRVDHDAKSASRAQWTFADLLRRTHQRDRALAAYERCAEMRDRARLLPEEIDVVIHVAIGDLLLPDARRALPHFERAVEISKKFPDEAGTQGTVAASALGETYARLDRNDEAAAMLDEALRRYARHPPPELRLWAQLLQNCVSVYVRQERFEDAARRAEELIEVLVDADFPPEQVARAREQAATLTRKLRGP